MSSMYHMGEQKIQAMPRADDPLLWNFQDGCQVGLLIIDFL